MNEVKEIKKAKHPKSDSKSISDVSNDDDVMKKWKQSSS